MRQDKFPFCIPGDFNFNPRTREGCDVKYYIGIVYGQDISIHAPARGATRRYDEQREVEKYFNPRTREGCDRGQKSIGYTLKDFNPRTREGCDVSSALGTPNRGTFQSTHPRGVRPLPSTFPNLPKLLFQSTHPRGVRQKIMSLSDADRHFNPRTREGCDGKPDNFESHYYIFQSTHPRGVRRKAAFGMDMDELFQSTHPRGVRHRGQGQSLCRIFISIHAPARGATMKAYIL